MQPGAKLPSSSERKLDRRRVPPKILEVMDKGQGRHPCCIAFTEMNSHLTPRNMGNGKSG